MESFEIGRGGISQRPPSEQVKWIDRMLTLAKLQPAPESFYLDLLGIQSDLVSAVGGRLAPEVHAAFDRVDAALRESKFRKE